MGSAEYTEIMTEIYDYNAEYLYHMGTVGMAPKIHIVKNNLRNVAEMFGSDAEAGVEILYNAQQFFWKQ